MKQSLFIAKFIARRISVARFSATARPHLTSLKAMLGTAGLTLVLSGVVMAQRPPKSQGARPHTAPAVAAVLPAAAFVMMFGTPTMIELTPEQESALTRMTPAQVEQFFQQQIDSAALNITRRQLQDVGVESNDVQDSIWNFIQTQEKKFKHLRELKEKLIKLSGMYKVGVGNDDTLKTTFEEVGKETEVANKQYAIDLAELDKKIRYSESPRLTAVLDTFGLLKPAPFFSLGLSFSELANMKLLSELKPQSNMPNFTFTAANAETADETGQIFVGSKPLSPKEQLQAIGIKDNEVQETVLEFIEVQEEKHKGLRDLKTRLMKLLKESKDDNTLKAALEELKKETEADQKQFVVDLAELDAKIHYSDDTRLKSALETLGLLKKDSTLTFGVNVLELLELKTRPNFVGAVGAAGSVG